MKTTYLIIFFFCCFNNIKAQNKNIFESNTKSLFSNIFKTKKYISKNIVKWKKEDLLNLNDYLEENKNRKDDLKLYAEALSLINHIQKNNLIKQAILQWDKSSFPKKCHLLSDIQFQKKVKNSLVPFSIKLNFLGKQLSLSQPIFSTDSKKALIKLDFSHFKKNNGYCQYRYIFCKKINNTWKIYFSIGDNCSFS